MSYEPRFMATAIGSMPFEAEIANLPVINTQRVQDVQRTLATGSFQIKPAEVADKMLQFEAGLGKAQQVLAFERQRDGFGLDRGRCLEARVFEGSHEVGLEAQRVKSRQCVSFTSACGVSADGWGCAACPRRARARRPLRQSGRIPCCLDLRQEPCVMGN